MQARKAPLDYKAQPTSGRKVMREQVAHKARKAYKEPKVYKAPLVYLPMGHKDIKECKGLSECKGRKACRELQLQVRKGRKEK